MANQIAEITQKLTTAPEMRDNTKMLMQPYANWEEYLTPAPLSIAILGELVFISSNEDFSLNKNPPKGGYQHIKYPDSFRACLMQVCNSGWQAFNEAHTSMDRIRIHTSTIPEYIRTTVDLLFSATDNAVEVLLPAQLDTIFSIAHDCETLAGNVEKKYSDVISLIQELLEACVSAKFFYGEELEKVQKKIEENKMKKQSALQLKESSEKMKEAMEKQMEEAQVAYKESMDSLPSGWDVVGMNFVDGLQSSVLGIMNQAISLVSGSMDVQLPNQNQGSGDEKVDKNIFETTEMEAICRSGEILKSAQNLDQYVSDSDIAWENLYDQKNKTTNTTWDMKQFNRIFSKINEVQKKGTKCEEALSLCETGIEICKDLAKYNPEEKWDVTSTQKMIERIKKLKDDAQKFDSKAKKTTFATSFNPKPPMKFESEKNMPGGQRKLAGDIAAENARFQIEQNRQQLNHTRKSYEKSVEKMEKNIREIEEILIEMKNCEIKEISFEQTIKILVKGLDAMGRVKEQWEKLVHFFQMISNIIQISLSKTLKHFVKISDTAMKLSYNEKLFTKDILYMQAFQASNVSSLVHMISSTYTEVSNKYLMDRVSSLGKLMAMDKEKPEFESERQKLQNSCKAAQDGILQLILKNKKEFERKTKVRVAKIESELKAVLPEASAEETKRIQENVQAGFAEGASNYY